MADEVASFMEEQSLIPFAENETKNGEVEDEDEKVMSSENFWIRNTITETKIKIRCFSADKSFMTG